MSHTVSHMHAFPPKDIAAAWNLTPADMHKRVDAAAAFNNNSSYSTAFLNSNGLSNGKLPGSRAGAPSQIGQQPRGGQVPQGAQIPQGSQIPQGAFGNVHAAPFRPGGRGLPHQAPAPLVCPLTKVILNCPQFHAMPSVLLCMRFWC